MSLINDALRRAGEVHRKRRPTARLLAPLQPVGSVRPANAGIKWIGLLLILSFGTAVWFLWVTLVPSNPEAEREAIVSAPNRDEIRSLAPESTVPPAGHPAPNQAVAWSLVPAEGITVNTNLVVQAAPRVNDESVRAADDSGLSAVTESAVLPSAGSFRLQSIILKSDGALAMVNGEMLRPGDSVLGARVVTISQDSVVLQRHGSNIVLRLSKL
jgi:MSHA biogenesis protein MshK